ncbi:MAG: M20 family metallopeptidase [Ktedonobacteraceae bacterium]|nr:M20 family metallopeptidase [Ktedonobacteraceae bacterium]MBV9713275.1 M20 family metallopeptidase [Ktedonobacteraceae bacterium]
MSVQSFVATSSFASTSPLPSVPSLVVDIEAYMQHRLARYIEELSHLCAIDSGTYYKPGLDEIALYLFSRMRDLGMDTTIIENEKWGNDFYGAMHGNGKGTLLLLGHIDTVYPVGTAAARPVRVEGDTIYGPGVIDMKGCILSAMYAIEALVAMNYQSFGEIRFLCVSDEEISDRHSRQTIQRASEGCDGVFVLEAARANGDIVSARKGGSWYTLKAYGHSAHAGVEPEKGHNAILELAHQILQFQSLNGWRHGLSINPGAISGGTAVNVVPDYAEVSFDMRFLTKNDKIETEKLWRKMMHVKRVPDVQLELEVQPDSREPMVCTEDNLQLAHQAQEIAECLGFPLNHAFTGGVSDANYVSSFGYAALDGLGPVGGLDHSPDEYMVMSSIAPRTALLGGLIATIGA